MNDSMIFGKGYWKTFRQGLEREWLVTNGIGGFAGSTMIGANARCQHGLLVASLHAPVQRTLILSKLEESLSIGDKTYSFAANERPGWEENGHHHLQRFVLEQGLPRFRYQVEDVFVDKRVAMVYGKNTVVIGYDVRNGARPSSLSVKPLVNYRGYGEQSTKFDLQFKERIDGSLLELVPLKNPLLTIRLHSERGQFEDAPKTFYEQMGTKVYHHSCYDENMLYHYEIVDGKAGIDTHYIPALLHIELQPHEHARFAIVCTIEEEGLPDKSGWQLIADEERRIAGLVEQAGLPDEGDGFVSSLVRAADHFIVNRKSTGMKTVLAGYPWFADWGRDTMIAMQGLTLPTGRLDDAREILWTFAKYVRNGLVPNMFPDEGQEPIYNTVDASLWYFHSVREFLRYSGTESDYTFIREQIYPVLKEIIAAYRAGTDFSIGMDETDGLIAAGSGLDQVTWMDVRVDGIVVTPRHGKPVEINALWYNALCVMSELAHKFGDDNQPYEQLAKRVKEAFVETFWNEADGCLYDVVSRDGIGDRQIRPNQIWAISLPFAMLPRDKEMRVVHKVLQKLYATYGLRSLDEEDAEYKPFYGGKLLQRDMAYHQGTVWSFPLGALVTAYCKVHEYSDEAVDFARLLLEPTADHLRDGCIGQIAEIFDGHEPIISRGCYAQAWGVGEALRAWMEDIIWRGRLPL
jgi:predicted glycogen debranching enzyme